MRTTLITVDPGQNTGIACWSASGDLIRTETLRVKGLGSLTYMNTLWSLFLEKIDEYEPDECLIEGVSVWSGSIKSMTAAKRGNLITLSYLVGGYIRMCYLCLVEPTIILPQQWKGQLPKKAMKPRIIRALGHDPKVNEHVLDAIGIGLSHFRRL